VFYSSLRDLCIKGKVEKFSLFHYIDTKRERVGYRIREESASLQAAY